jgi:hypothetical protein
LQQFFGVHVTGSRGADATLAFTHGHAAKLTCAVNSLAQTRTFTRQWFAPPTGDSCQ